MVCGNDFNTGNCVCDILAEIADAQQDVSQDCLGSCSESVRELMGGMAPTNFNTVPIQLICNSPNNAAQSIQGGFCGNVFVAQGFRRAPNGVGGQLVGATSSFFRVTAVDTDKCCAVLELLCVSGISAYGPDPDFICQNFGAGVAPETVDYDRTGICITVDLNCFCGVSCLPAVSIPSAT